MKHNVVLYSFTLFLAALSQLLAGEKVGTTSFQFLKMPLDARSAAMGGAAISSVNTSEALFWNPAGLRRTTGLDVSTSYVDYFLDVNMFSGAISMPLGQSSAVGLFAVVVDYGSIDVTDADHLFFNADWTYNPGLTGEKINPRASVFGISYALSVTDKLTFGVSAKYQREDLIMAKGSTVAFDGGLTFDTGWRTLRFGAAIRNFGPDVTFIKESYPLPETFTVGISGYLFSSNESLFMKSSSQSLLLSYDLSHPRDYDQQHHFGVEYTVMDFLSLRGGYKLNFDEEGVTYGIGVKFNNFRLDYAYDHFGTVLPSVHRISIGYALN
ncbi:MAG: PorV/PorQ family protein [bacterium]